MLPILFPSASSVAVSLALATSAAMAQAQTSVESSLEEGLRRQEERSRGQQKELQPHSDVLRAASSSDPPRVLRMRQTRWGWAVICRTGDGPEQAFEVDARGGQPGAISPARAFEQWTTACARPNP
jgi:hypothetical protein